MAKQQMLLDDEYDNNQDLMDNSNDLLQGSKFDHSLDKDISQNELNDN